MTLRSAREMRQRAIDEHGNDDGICLPLSIDALLPHSELPSEFYDFIQQQRAKPDGSHDYVMSVLFEEFFGVSPQKSDPNPIAKFDAFDTSPQPYFRYTPYNPSDPGNKYMLRHGTTPEQLRLNEILVQAGRRACGVLFMEESAWGGHVKALLPLDDPYGDPQSSLYAVLDNAIIDGQRLYTPTNFAGIGKKKKSKYSPLPQVKRERFPEGQSSWELIVLPPDPKLSK